MKHAIALAASGLVFAASSLAGAQTDDDDFVAVEPVGDTYEAEIEGGAPEDALEIGVQGGYTQPFGDVAEDRPFDRISDAGGAFAVDLGYRFTPFVSLSILSQYHEQVVGGDIDGESDLRGFAGTLQTTAHFTPYDTVDPYFTFGTGYRVLWLAPAGEANDVIVHGFQLARATLGVDFRLDDSLALGPVAGADLNLFLWESNPGPEASNDIDDPRPSTFVFAGLAGRFDIGGRRVGEVDYEPVAAR